MTKQRQLPRFLVLLNSLDGKYQSDVLRGILTTLHGKAKVLVVVAPAFEQQNRALEQQRLRARLPDPSVVDGAIVLSGTLRLDSHDVQMIASVYRCANGVAPVVSVGVEAQGISAIVVDDEFGVRAAVQHLREHNCKNIAFLRGPGGNAEAERRFNAYRKTMGESYRQELVSDLGDFSFRSGREATEELLGAWPEIDGIVAANDEIARGALAAIRNRDDKPKIIGFDDTEYAGATDPPLTTVRQPLEREGQLAARRMLALYQGTDGGTPRVISLCTALQVRESCGCVLGAPIEHRLRTLSIRQLFTDSAALHAFRRILQNASELDSEAEATHILDSRLAWATSTDTGGWLHALMDLSDFVTHSLPSGDRRRTALESFFRKLIDKVLQRGSKIALGYEDRHVALRAFREAPDVAGFEKALTSVAGRFWVCVNSTPDLEPAMLQVEMGCDAVGVSFPESHVIPDHAIVKVAVSYPLEAGDVRGHVVFELGAAHDWWVFGELAALVRNFYRGRPSIPSSSPLAGPGSPLVHSLEEFENEAGPLLDVLGSAARFGRASLQLLEGESRSIVLKRGFKEEHRPLLRPVSCDALVDGILTARVPRFIDDTSTLGDEWQPLQGVAAWIGAPIVYQDTPIGLLTLDFPEVVDKLEAKYGTAVKRFADQVAPLLTSVRPYVREAQLAERTRLVRETMNLLANKLEPEALLQTIANELARLLNCAHCTLFFPRPVDGREVLMAAQSSSERTQGRCFAMGEGYAGYVWKNGSPLLITEVSNEDDRFAKPRRPQGKRSMLVVPIKVVDQTIGVISADQDAIGWFTFRDQELLDALAQQAALAIQRSRAVKFVQEIASSILSLDDGSQILAKVVESAVRLANADDGVIYQLSPDKQKVTKSFPRHSEKHPPPRLDNGGGLTRRIIAQQRPIPIPDLQNDHTVNPMLRGGPWKSLVGVPLVVGQDVIGVLFVNDKNKHVFSEFEVSLLQNLADLAAIALQRAEAGPSSDVPELPPFQRLLSSVLGTTISTCVYLFNKERNEFELPQAYGPLADVLREPPRPKGTGRRVLETGIPLYQSDTAHPGENPPVNPTVEREIKSFAALPLNSDGNCVGALFIAAQEPVEFDGAVRQGLELYARHLAGALATTARFAAYRKASRRLAVRVSRHLVNYDHIERRIAEECSKLAETGDDIWAVGAKLRTHTDALKALLFEFLRLGEPIDLQCEPHAFNSLVTKALEEHRRSHRSNIERTMSLECDLPVLVDRERIHDCVLRLLSNAEYALRLAGRSEMHVFTAHEDGMCVFGVENNAAPFPADMDPKAPFEGLFEDGLGIGLSVVEATVAAHGGRLELAQSKRLRGSLVKVLLPIRASTDA